MTVQTLLDLLSRAVADKTLVAELGYGAMTLGTLVKGPVGGFCRHFAADLPAIIEKTGKAIAFLRLLLPQAVALDALSVQKALVTLNEHPEARPTLEAAVNGAVVATARKYQ